MLRTYWFYRPFFRRGPLINVRLALRLVRCLAPIGDFKVIILGGAIRLSESLGTLLLVPLINGKAVWSVLRPSLLVGHRNFDTIRPSLRKLRSTECITNKS